MTATEQPVGRIGPPQPLRKFGIRHNRFPAHCLSGTTLRFQDIDSSNMDVPMRSVFDHALYEPVSPGFLCISGEYSRKDSWQ